MLSDVTGNELRYWTSWCKI